MTITALHCRPSKTIESTHQQCSKEWPATDGYAERQERGTKGRGIEHHQSSHPQGMFPSPSHANGAPPIVDHEHAAVDIEMIKQMLQVFLMVVQTVGRVLRFIGKTAAQMIGDDATVAILKRNNFV